MKLIKPACVLFFSSFLATIAHGAVPCEFDKECEVGDGLEHSFSYYEVLEKYGSRLECKIQADSRLGKSEVFIKPFGGDFDFQPLDLTIDPYPAWRDFTIKGHYTSAEGHGFVKLNFSLYLGTASGRVKCSIHPTEVKK